MHQRSCNQLRGLTINFGIISTTLTLTHQYGVYEMGIYESKGKYILCITGKKTIFYGVSTGVVFWVY